MCAERSLELKRADLQKNWHILGLTCLLGLQETVELVWWCSQVVEVGQGKASQQMNELTMIG